jgi:predicted nucleic acid binding AN1-type Zn finger protein
MGDVCVDNDWPFCCPEALPEAHFTQSLVKLESMPPTEENREKIRRIRMLQQQLQQQSRLGARGG